MNTKVKILIIVLIFGFFLYLLLEQQLQNQIYTTGNCTIIEKQIREKISEANYCNKNEDCIITSFDCLFGCWNIINRNELDTLKLLVKKYDECRGDVRCIYRCASPPEAVGCENGVCVQKPSKMTIWTEKMREKYCENYSKVLNEKLYKIEPKPRGALFHRITLGEILKITKKDCDYILNISSLEYIYVPYIGKEIELLHPKQLYYVGDCNESLNLKEHDKIIGFSILYEVNDTFPTWTICISKLAKSYGDAIRLSEEQ